MSEMCHFLLQECGGAQGVARFTKLAENGEPK